MSNLPNDTRPESKKKKTGCLKAVLLILLVFAILIYFTLSGIAKWIANSQLDKQLLPEAEIGSLHLGLLRGRVMLGDFTIAQPEGFEGETMVNLNKLTVQVPPGKAIGRDPVEVRKGHLDGLNLHLIRDTNQVLNLSRMVPPRSEPAEKGDPVPLWIKEVLLENINLHFQDQAKDWGIKVKDLRLELHNIQIDYDAGKGPGRITADFVIPEGRKDGRVKLIAKIAPLSPSNPDRKPPMQLALGIIGFDLGLLDPFLQPSPAVAKTAFGGSAFDFLLFFELGEGKTQREQPISGTFRLTTNTGTRLDDKLDGTFTKPVLPFTSLFADILGNQFGRITQWSGNVAGAGLEAGKAVADTGVAAMKGAGKTVTGLAGGLLRTTKGVVALDKDEALGGIKDTTVGTAENLAGTVRDTAGTVASGVGDTAGAATGKTKSDTWFSRIDERLTAFETEADAWFEANPFPGSE